MLVVVNFGFEVFYVFSLIEKMEIFVFFCKFNYVKFILFFFNRIDLFY